MTKQICQKNGNPKTQKMRFTSFKNQHCPYCGGPAKLEEVPKGYRGSCDNPDCKAENFFTNKKAREWFEELSP
jgi:hypothetical protein